MEAEVIEQPSTEVSELIQSIGEAKQEIAEVTQAIDKKERKGGRPKGSTDKQPRKKKGQVEVQSNLNPSPSVDQGQDLAPTAEMIMPMLEGVIKFPFDIAASRTGCEKLRVTEEEAKPTVQALDQFLRFYMPDLNQADPKLVAAFTLISSASLLGYAKFQVYSDWKAEEDAKLKKQLEQAQPQPPTPQPVRAPQSPFEVIQAN